MWVADLLDALDDELSRRLGPKWWVGTVLQRFAPSHGELMWKGVAYRGDREFLEACCGLDPASGTAFDSDVVPGYVLCAGTEIPFLEFSKAADPAVFAALPQVVLSRDLQMNVCYCSIFDECWQGDLTALSLKPKQVEACTLPKVSFDQGISNGKR